MNKDNKNGHTNHGFTKDEHWNKFESARSSTTSSSKIKIPNYDDYDPYLHRKVEHPTTDNETLIHLLKGSLGTGILGMPMAFKYAGYVTGAIATTFIGLLSTYCVHTLLRAQYELCKRNRVASMTYPEVAEAALKAGPGVFPKLGTSIPHITNLFLMLFQLGTSCVYVVFIAKNLKSIVDIYTDENIDERLFMLMILLPLILINWIRNLKLLAPLSTIANLITLVSFCIIVYYIFFTDPLQFEKAHAFGKLEDFPLFFGMVLFALEAIGVIFPLENEMKTPGGFKKPFGVLNKAMSVIIFLYVGMGCFGYIRFFDDIQGSITLNLKKEDVLAQCVKVMLAFSIFITHALQNYVAIDIIWSDYVQKYVDGSRKRLVVEYIIRTGTTIFTFLMAVAIPNLELFISLVGALCLAVLGLALPASIDCSTWWYQRHGNQKIRLICVNTFIFVLGIVGFIVGTTTSIVQIITEFSK